MFFPAPSIPLPSVHAPKWVLIPLTFAALLAACGGSAPEDEEPVKETLAASTSIESDAPPVEVAVEGPPVVYTAPLTGEVIDAGQFAAIEGRKPLAVMIDNLAAAAPQAGIDQADVVIEALVEGGITRYMAIFQSKDPEVIEPVRSARTPFLQWAAEYDALYVHVGSAELDGPADAGSQIYEWGIRDLDLGTKAFVYSYVRDPKRKAPHNVLISAATMREKAAQLGLEGPVSLASWTFTSAEGLKPGLPAPGFSVRFGVMSPRYVVRWNWDPESLRYLRSQYGAPQFDAASGLWLGFENVIVQYADAYIADRNGHVLIDLIGEGRAQVFTNGQLVEGTWRKPERAARTEFFDAEGAPIPLLAGTTWIEVVPPSGGAVVD
jgi:hypothetical protein